MRPHAERRQQYADQRNKVKSVHQHVDATAESDPKINCERKPFQSKRGCTTSCNLRSTVSTCKTWTEPSSKKVSNSSRLCAGRVCGVLFGHKERLQSALAREVRPHLKPKRTGSICRKSHHASPTCCAGHPCQVGSKRVPSLATHRSLRDHHHEHRRVIWTTAEDQKTSQVLADESGTLAQTAATQGTQ